MQKLFGGSSVTAGYLNNNGDICIYCGNGIVFVCKALNLPHIKADILKILAAAYIIAGVAAAKLLFDRIEYAGS